MNHNMQVINISAALVRHKTGPIKRKKNVEKVEKVEKAA